MTPILLTTPDLVVAASLLAVDAGLSLALRLGLARQLAWAAARMVVQLVAVGCILRAVFALASPAATRLVVGVMTAVAGREAARRSRPRPR